MLLNELWHRLGLHHKSERVEPGNGGLSIGCERRDARGRLSGEFEMKLLQESPVACSGPPGLETRPDRKVSIFRRLH